jgi:hypothetical protein
VRNSATVMGKGVGGSENAKPGSSGVGIDSSVRLRSIKMVCRDMLRRSLKTGDNTAALVFCLSCRGLSSRIFHNSEPVVCNRPSPTCAGEAKITQGKLDF